MICPFRLPCLIAALLCNCDGTEAVAGWCRDHVDLLREVFGPRLFLTPCGSLYRWLLPQLDASATQRVLGQWVQATTQAAADEPLALDGKTARGARAGEQPAPHLLALVTHQSQETFFQVRVDEKTNEIPVAKQALPTFLTTYFADPHACSQQAETVDRRSVRISVRTIKVSTEMHAYLAFSWPGIAKSWRNSLAS